MHAHHHTEEHHHDTHVNLSEKWRKVTAVLTTISALLIAVSSFQIENYNHHSLIYKNDAVNQWGFFQAKNIREKIFEVAAQELTFTKNNDPFFSEKAVLAQSYKDNVIRYQNEQEEIKNNAEKSTKKSEYYEKKADRFEMAQVFFELAIVLNAIFLLINLSYFLFFSVGVQIIGVGLILVGYFI